MKHHLHLLPLATAMLLLASCGTNTEKVTLRTQQDTLSWAMGMSLAQTADGGRCHQPHEKGGRTERRDRAAPSRDVGRRRAPHGDVGKREHPILPIQDRGRRAGKSRRPPSPHPRDEDDKSRNGREMSEKRFILPPILYII